MNLSLPAMFVGGVSTSDPKQRLLEAEELLSYCTRKGISVPTSLLQELSDLGAALNAHTTIQIADDVRLWSVLASLTQLAAPATFTSLDVNTRLWKGIYFVFFLLVLGVLLYSQFFLYIGSGLSADVSSIEKQAQDATDAGYARQFATPQAAAVPAGTATPAAPTPEQRQASDNLMRLNEQLTAKTKLLASWVATADRTVSVLGLELIAKAEKPSDQTNTDPFIAFFDARERAREQQTKALMYEDGLRLYWLPLLFGVLGALMYVLRKIGKEGDLYIGEGDWTRIAFGSAAGVGMGLFFSTSADHSQAGATLPATMMSLSPFALAFAGGYSADILFAVLDKLVSAFGPTPGVGAPAINQPAMSTQRDPKEIASHVETNGTAPKASTQASDATLVNGETKKPGTTINGAQAEVSAEPKPANAP